MPKRTPLDGQVWRSPNGRPMLYVRTEQTPGQDVPRHLFVEAHERITWYRWLPEGDMPEEYELVSDGHAAERARKDRETLVAERIEHQLETWTLKGEHQALVDVMKRAVALVSPVVGADLRRAYSEAKGRHLYGEGSS